MKIQVVAAVLALVCAAVPAQSIEVSLLIVVSYSTSSAVRSFVFWRPSSRITERQPPVFCRVPSSLCLKVDVPAPNSLARLALPREERQPRPHPSVSATSSRGWLSPLISCHISCHLSRAIYLSRERHRCEPRLAAMLRAAASRTLPSSRFRPDDCSDRCRQCFSITSSC